MLGCRRCGRRNEGEKKSFIFYLHILEVYAIVYSVGLSIRIGVLDRFLSRTASGFLIVCLPKWAVLASFRRPHRK